MYLIDYYDDSYTKPVFTIVRINGRGYNVQMNVGQTESEMYVSAKNILRKITPLEGLL